MRITASLNDVKPFLGFKLQLNVVLISFTGGAVDKNVFKTEEKRFPCDSDLTQQRVTLSQCDTLVYYR